MKETQRTKGITLIALVVTIVVLLILAAVSINLVLGNNGIIRKAQDAGELTLLENARTEVAMMLQEYQISKIKTEDLTMTEFFKEKKNDGNITEYNTDDEDLKVEKDGYVATIDSNGEIIEIKKGSLDPSAEEPDDTELPEGIKIGDYVAYTYDAKNTGYSLPATVSGCNEDQTINQESLTWNVLNINDDGSIDIVGTYPTTNGVKLYGALGYNNGVFVLNDICAYLYGNSSLGNKITVRSINITDFEKHMTQTAIDNRAEIDPNYGSAVTITGKIYYPALYAKQKEAGIDTTSVYTATGLNEMDETEGLKYLDPYGGSSNEITSATTQTYLQTTTQLTVTNTFYRIFDIDSANYGEAGKLLGDTFTEWYDEDTIDCGDIWIATRGTSASTSSATFDIFTAGNDLEPVRMFTVTTSGVSSSTIIDPYTRHLRPVIHLSAGLLTGERDSSNNNAWKIKGL